MYMTCHRH